MSLSKKVYKGILRIKDISKRKSFTNAFMLFGVFILFFATFNVYAASETAEPDWSGTKEFFNTVSGVDAGKRSSQDNVTTAGGTQMLNSAWSGVTLIAPEVSPDYQAVLNNPNIPNDMKRGLLGLSVDASNAIYANYPIVDIPRHLANQWVPGFQENTTALYAQSFSNGYEELKYSGIDGLWARSLNLSYVFFVIVMIISGFMIMFRHKLGGQTMVTLASVLPKVITSLIVATFSFTIAGLLIDLGGILINFIMYIYGLSDASSIAGLFKIMGSVLSVPGGIGMGLGGIAGGVVGALGVKALLVGATVGTGLAALPALALGLAVVGILGMVILLGLLGIILAGSIKVLITLFKAYFQLLIAVILGPIQITIGAIPGNPHAIKNWFLSVLRNVLVFPVVFAIINLPNALIVEGEMKIRFPGKLVYEDPSTYAPDGVDIQGGLFLWILKIFVLFFAAQAPKFLEKWFPPDSSKAFGEGMGNAKASMSKIPLIGGMFK